MRLNNRHEIGGMLHECRPTPSTLRSKGQISVNQYLYMVGQQQSFKKVRDARETRLQRHEKTRQAHERRNVEINPTAGAIREKLGDLRVCEK